LQQSRASLWQIAGTIFAMGFFLGFKVLAEGVETSEHLAFLRAKIGLYQKSAGVGQSVC
jgi:EAL domain-containing protein (putative c-di-GMP-specific phosphodiesterase class I)